jgi:hypothetical protein
MAQLTLTNVYRAQKNKRNLDTMTLLDSDDERGDKEDRYEYDDEGSLYAESTGDDATEAASECADDDNTGNKAKKTTAAAVAKPRGKRSETSTSRNSVSFGSRMSLFWVSFRSHTLDRDETESVPNRDRSFLGLKPRPRDFEGEMSRKRQ